MLEQQVLESDLLQARLVIEFYPDGKDFLLPDFTS